MQVSVNPLHLGVGVGLLSSDKVDLLFLLDPLESLYGPLMPAYLIAKELKTKFDIVFVSPTVGENTANLLESCGIEAINLHKRLRSSGSMLTLEAWFRRAVLELSRSDCVVVNFSQCFLAKSHVYYAQGPVTKALDDIITEMKKTYKIAYKFLRRFLVRRDKAFVRKLAQESKILVANSAFCASMYREWGFPISQIIFPPLDCSLFKPTTSHPKGDYVLAYAGKETRYSVLKKIAEAGVRVKAFGGKTPYVSKSLHSEPNMEFLGKVSDAELVDLYSNALFTLSAFTHEPFGYVPVESMACGTPVLTYNRQGPSESVINGLTGWTTVNDQHLTEAAISIWKNGYATSFRTNCRNRALDFDIKTIANEWRKLIQPFAEGCSKGSHFTESHHDARKRPCQ
jgi:glycosyltransferase involved in cell wall biosynthesis